MDSILQLVPQQRAELYSAVAQKTDIDAVVIEKDFWVCWILKQLFSLPGIGENLIFKGGTSLSKIFKIIERFSEDIDVSIDRGFLGFGGHNEPEAGSSEKERQRRIEALKAACQLKIAQELSPALKKSIESKLRRNEKWALRLDEADPDRQTLLFEYPVSFPLTSASYIRRAVKIEMGARADHWPYESKRVTPYVAEHFPEGIKDPSCIVKVLSVERTFWEKATILHAEYHRPMAKAMPERFSRHYSDFYELLRKGVATPAMANLDLLDRVTQHKSLFFKSAWAKYKQAARGTLKIAPPKHRLKVLHDDYIKMRQMFFGDPPAFDAILTSLQQWESDFNKR